MDRIPIGTEVVFKDHTKLDNKETIPMFTFGTILEYEKNGRYTIEIAELDTIVEGISIKRIMVVKELIRNFPRMLIREISTKDLRNKIISYYRSLNFCNNKRFVDFARQTLDIIQGDLNVIESRLESLKNVSISILAEEYGEDE